MMLAPRAAALGALALLLCHCGPPADASGSDSGVDGGVSGATGGGLGGGSGGGSGGGTGGSVGGGVGGGTGGGTGGALSSGGPLTLPPGSCFWFGSNRIAPNTQTPSCGDLRLSLRGPNTGLYILQALGSGGLCVAPNTTKLPLYASLGAIPLAASCPAGTAKDQSAFFGQVDQAHTGTIVTGATGVHHYRLWIERDEVNADVGFTFFYDQVD